MSSSVHANNKTKNILVLGKYFVQGLDNTTIYAKKLYSINFTKTNSKLCLSLHYNGANSYLLMVQKFINLKQKILRLWQLHYVDNMKKTELNGYVYDFSVDYDAIAVDDILDIHKYLMEKNGIV